MNLYYAVTRLHFHPSLDWLLETGLTSIYFHIPPFHSLFNYLIHFFYSNLSGPTIQDHTKREIQAWPSMMSGYPVATLPTPQGVWPGDCSGAATDMLVGLNAPCSYLCSYHINLPWKTNVAHCCLLHVCPYLQWNMHTSNMSDSSLARPCKSDFRFI